MSPQKGVYMSFPVVFYNNTDDPIVLNKTPSQLFSKTMDPLGEVNELNPYFEVKYHTDYNNVNYAYIDTFKKWYFVVKSLLPDNMWGLQFVVDPLMSNKTAIEELTCVIKRTGKEGSKPSYVQDELLPIEKGRQFLYKFPFDSSPHGTVGPHMGAHLVIHTI